MSVVSRSHSNNSTSSPSKSGGKKQGKKLAKREAKLMLKVEQARKDVQKSQGKVAKAQAQLDDNREQLHGLEEKLAALRNPEQQSGQNGNAQMQEDNTQDNTGMTGQQNQQSLPSNETYVGNAFDTELARTPGEARGDVLQAESQEQYQTDAIARDMEHAEDQGVASTEPENQDQGSDAEQSQEHGQHSNTFFESRSEPDEQTDQGTSSEQNQDQEENQDNFAG